MYKIKNCKLMSNRLYEEGEELRIYLDLDITKQKDNLNFTVSGIFSINTKTLKKDMILLRSYISDEAKKEKEIIDDINIFTKDDDVSEKIYSLIKKYLIEKESEYLPFLLYLIDIKNKLHELIKTVKFETVGDRNTFELSEIKFTTKYFKFLDSVEMKIEKLIFGDILVYEPELADEESGKLKKSYFEHPQVRLKKILNNI